MPWDMWINIKQKKSLTTRLVFHAALDEQVQVGINLHNFKRHLLMTLVSLTGDVIRHTRTVLIRKTGDDKKDFIWNDIDYFSDSGKQ